MTKIDIFRKYRQVCLYFFKNKQKQKFQIPKLLQALEFGILNIGILEV
ncbi:hypothetical protein [Flavobacterium sp. MDT1-60]|nr:hypothetical protein [Flavobacterium sp. MDT1-60]QOG00864.1 hypothetical protein IHE43_13675 [Flavobacterium sp. MDT1-60]